MDISAEEKMTLDTRSPDGIEIVVVVVVVVLIWEKILSMDEKLKKKVRDGGRDERFERDSLMRYAWH